MKFIELKLSDTMQKVLAEINYITVSEIQKQAIPSAMSGRDIIGQAQTGTGKTASFGIPIVEMTKVGDELQHIILAPSRELAMQIHAEIKKLIGPRNLKIMDIIGGVSYSIQENNLFRKPNIIVATPGRFIDFVNKKLINVSKVKTFTLDEADEMLNFGFYKDILFIYNLLPKDVQIFFFTATFNKNTKQLAQNITKNAFEIKVSSGFSTSNNIEQKFILVKEMEKLEILTNLLHLYTPKAAIIFGKTKRRVEELTTALNSLNLKVLSIQGDMSQKERSNSIKKFRDGISNILVCTDVMARGIDVENIDYVFNFDLPQEIEYYTHRIGRTGRANRLGIAISFVKPTEIEYFWEIMKATSSSPKELFAPSNIEIEQVKHEKIDDLIKKTILNAKEKHLDFSKEIINKYSKEEMGIFISASLLNEEKNTNNIILTPEQSNFKKGFKKNNDSKFKGKISDNRKNKTKNYKKWNSQNKI